MGVVRNATNLSFIFDYMTADVKITNSEYIGALKDIINAKTNELRITEDELRKNNIFHGAGIVYITLSDKKIGKKLNIFRNNGEYEIAHISTNGALREIENEVEALVGAWNSSDNQDVPLIKMRVGLN